MEESELAHLGAKLRKTRLGRGISLRHLARELGVSASLLSQIETGKSQPSVSTLYSITTALGLAMGDLFDAPPAGVQHPRGLRSQGRSEPTQAENSRDTSRAPSHATRLSVADERLGPLVTPDDRRVLHLDSGVTWEWLGNLPHSKVEFLLMTYHPGGTSSSSGGLMRHPGAEYGYLISGELVLTLGFEEFKLRAGDAVSFLSTTPHSYRNDSSQPAVGIWFVLEDLP